MRHCQQIYREKSIKIKGRFFSKEFNSLLGKKMIEESKISKKGQITIPKDIREKMGLKAGDKVIFETFAEGFLIRKKEESDFQKILDEIVGIWEDHPLFKDKTTREIIEIMRGPDDDTKQQ